MTFCFCSISFDATALRPFASKFALNQTFSSSPYSYLGVQLLTDRCSSHRAALS